MNQSYKDFELIIVDDGSADMTAEISERIAGSDDRVRVLHQVNGGQSNARNNGTRAGRAPYVTYVDSDDRIEPCSLEYLMRALKESHADIACGRIDRVREDFELSGEAHAFSWEGFDRVAALSEMLTGRKLTVGPCCRLVPREWMLTNPFLEGKYYEDLSNTYKLNLKANKTAFVNAPLYHYVMRSGSITGRRHTTARQCMDYYESIGLCSRGVLERYPELRDDAAVLMARDYMSLYLSIRRCPERGRELQQIQDEVKLWMKKNWTTAFRNGKAPGNVRLRAMLFGLSPVLYEKAYYAGIHITGKRIG